jgi:hypothetical protein
MACCLLDLGCHRHLVGHRPHEPHQLTGHGHDHLVGMFFASQQAAVAFAQSHWGVPADVLDRFGVVFQSELERPADFGGRAVPQAPSTSARRACVWPAVVIEPCWRRSPLAYSEGISPKNFMSCLG